jgi:hypothetical protein
MWNFDASTTHDGRTTHVAIAVDGTPLSFAAALGQLGSERPFREYLTGLLASAPYAAFRWELPPVSTATLSRPFEFVMVDDPRLERAPDPGTFASYFTAPDAPDVIATDNLSHTATLVVPRAVAPLVTYVHLARFVRSAPSAQIHALWRCLATTATRRLSAHRQWISTAGAGVSWLHVRIDDAPKYYVHRPYVACD